MRIHTLRAVLGVLILLAAAAAVEADDRDTLRRMLSSPGTIIDHIRIAEGWAVVSSHDRNTGGCVVLRKLDGRWRKMHGGGGAVSPGYLYLVGAPRGALEALTGRPLLPHDVDEVAELERGPNWKRLARAKITDLDLRSENWWILTIMRNEIYARHGRPFKDPLLREYFQSRPWYRVNPAYNDRMLNAYEKYNVQFILDFQKRNNRFD